MAKKIKKEKVAGQVKAKRKKGKASPSWVNAMLAVILLFSFVFLSSAVLLFIGLLPFFVAFFVDRSKKKTKAITVGAMNIAGCAPFLMELWATDRAMDSAFSIILDPMVIIVIYAAAGVGYLIDWGVTVVVAGLLYHRGVSRIGVIEKRQKELIERWGEEVSGKVAVDHEGFSIEEPISAKS